MLEVTKAEAFKWIEGHERHYTPNSEYIFKTIQPVLEDTLFLGRSYETLFDKFEVLYSLVFADIDERTENHLWGPIGRFGWKFKSRNLRDNPFMDVKKEAERQQDKWPPLQAGLFGGSYERFREIATKFEENLNQLNWF